MCLRWCYIKLKPSRRVSCCTSFEHWKFVKSKDFCHPVPSFLPSRVTTPVCLDSDPGVYAQIPKTHIAQNNNQCRSLPSFLFAFCLIRHKTIMSQFPSNFHPLGPYYVYGFCDNPQCKICLRKRSWRMRTSLGELGEYGEKYREKKYE